jgi:hypothetical protein
MNQQTDVPDRKFCDFGDFLIAEIALKLQNHHFALVLRQPFQHAEDLAGGFPLFEMGIDADFGIFEGSHAGLLFARVEGEIAANREEPLSDVTTDLHPVFAAQPQERFLHDLSGDFSVSKHPRCVSQQRGFVEIQGLDDPLRFGIVHIRAFTSDNCRRRQFLSMIEENPGQTGDFPFLKYKKWEITSLTWIFVPIFYAISREFKAEVAFGPCQSNDRT